MPLRFMRLLVMMISAAVLASSCAQSEAAAAPIFGTQDTLCVSVRYYGTTSDRLAEDSIDCFMDQVEAGRSVTVDIAARTLDGAIYRRYAFDGTTTLVVQDSRGDAVVSGSGLPPLFANRCDTIQRTTSFPAASDCEPAEHAGFPEALAAQAARE